MKHKHAEVIKAWADGAEIEYRYLSNISHDWTEWKPMYARFGWIDSDDYEYRIKPEEKKPVVRWLWAFNDGKGWKQNSYFMSEQEAREAIKVHAVFSKRLEYTRTEFEE